MGWHCGCIVGIRRTPARRQRALRLVEQAAYFNPENWLFPYLFCGFLIFLFGGITVIVNASYSMNNVVHNTAWIAAHFHLTVGGPISLGILGGSLLIITGLLKKPVVSDWMAALVDGRHLRFFIRSLSGRAARRTAAHQPRLDLYESSSTQLSVRLVGSSPNGHGGRMHHGARHPALLHRSRSQSGGCVGCGSFGGAVFIAGQRDLSRRRRFRGAKFHTLGGGSSCASNGPSLGTQAAFNFKSSVSRQAACCAAVSVPM